MKNISQNRITLIDGLADITRHHEQNMLEESVLKTITDLFPVETLHLYRLHIFNENKQLSLILLIDKEGQVAVENNLPTHTVSEKLNTALLASIENKKIELLNYQHSGWDVIYPILNADKEVFSLLVCRFSEPPSLDEQQIMSGVLSVYSNYLSLIEKTQRDKLTGLFNRETLDSEITKVLLKESFEHSQKKNTSDQRQSDDLNTWLGVIDIDHFKLINDTYGHLYGDEVLILVARLMMGSCVREDDLVYRYGGEEFVVILKAANEHHALMAFDRLRQNVYEHSFPQVGNVAISIGFVQVLGQQSPSDVIGMADDALYYAKENGRNQTVSHKNLLDQGKLIVTKHVDNNDVDMFIDEVIF